MLTARAFQLVAGIDEAGRGPLAGPVVAAAVILDDLHPIKGLKDSKQLGPRTRERLFDEIRAKALCCSIAQASVQEIDELNILQATLLAMQRAVQRLAHRPEVAWIDGQHCPALDCPTRAIVGGDGTIAAIAAASILAKTDRDAMLIELDRDYPQYGFCRHKGYGTPEHLAALAAHGPCPAHRRSFSPVSQLRIAFV